MNNDRYIFRGKRINNGEWVQGSFFDDEYTGGTYNAYIMYEMLLEIDNDQNCEIFGQSIFEVDPETIGRCTGLEDKNDTLIFEGDIVRGRNEYEISDVICKDGVWTLSMFAGHAPALWEIQPVEIIGNIWDNPELIPKNFI